MTDNGSAYRSRLFAKALQAAGARHVRTRPYTPRTNGKAERFIQTSLKAWAYGRPYACSDDRSTATTSTGHTRHQGPYPLAAREQPSWKRQLGRSRGGRTTKIHGLVDERRRPRVLLLSAGNVNDISMAHDLIQVAGPFLA